MKNFVSVLFALLLCLNIVLFVSCKKNNLLESNDVFIPKKKDTFLLFTEVKSLHSNIDFKNIVTQNDEFNFLKYVYVFNGGGVAVGDINNDDLLDIYFTSNQNTNKLYLNKGNFKFEDITQKANAEDDKGWTTGVTMIDINNDGWQDIYVCKSGYPLNEKLRKNKLYINQKNGTFKEEAERWGLDHKGFSVQSYFFDYDKDGDLDMYLVNHSVDFENVQRVQFQHEKKYSKETSDHLFRNDGKKFTEVTKQANLINKEWGLSASIGDFNNDGWQDIYVANDYVGPDFLYINKKDGTFRNEIGSRFKHISFNSMGSDYADINNDFLPDLLVLDMLAEDHIRSKENMPTMNTKGFYYLNNSGFHYPYMSNMLQLNKGNGYFSDIGQFAGIAKTDWSWAPLIADFDCDGNKDIFITNGIEYDFANQDFNRETSKMMEENSMPSIQKLVELLPSTKLSNYIFKNNNNLTFENKSKSWGLSKKVNSNGVAYADLDNDGDLDLILNNMSDTASVYKNNTSNNYLSIKLIGDKKNIDGIGAKVKVYTKSKKQYQELYVSRGFQSSVSNVLNFGIGKEENIDSIQVIWHDGSVSQKNNIKANRKVFIEKAIAEKEELNTLIASKFFKKVNPINYGINFRHKEDNYNDFQKQVLLPQKLSQQGPALSVADINNDGLEDFFVGGARNQSAEMYLQKKDGKFSKINKLIFDADRKFEDVKSIFFDADNDSDLDLYVTSGGYDLSEDSPFLQDRIYINDGVGNFSKGVLPKKSSATKSITYMDYDKDGDNDLIIGGHAIPGKYPLASNTYILENRNGTFFDVTKIVAPELINVGIVNDVIPSDYDNDGDKDLFVVGEWIPIMLFENNSGKFSKKNIDAFKDTNGWWNTIREFDLDGDGDLDYLVGNLGENNKFHPSKEKPLHIYSNNFDKNSTYDMVLSKFYKGKLVPIRGKECSTDQNAFVSEKIKSYKNFAASSLVDIYGEEELKSSFHSEVYTFSSVCIVNNGNSTFEVRRLPSAAQLGPTMAFEVEDLNGDGFLDVFGVGNIYETEVETIRYDANTGYVLLGNAKGSLVPENDNSLFTNGNVKEMKKIIIKGKKSYLVVYNNGQLCVFMIV